MQKKTITTGADISAFLIDLGFIHYHAGNGCHEFIKKIDDLESIQIRGDDFAAIESIEDAIEFGIFMGSGPHRNFVYQFSYCNFREMVARETNIDWYDQLNWIID